MLNEIDDELYDEPKLHIRWNNVRRTNGSKSNQYYKLKI